MNDLPLQSLKFFVYFDLNKQVYIGMLYPKSTDNIEKIKIDIQKKLIDREIPIDSYPFEWLVTPK